MEARVIKRMIKESCHKQQLVLNKLGVQLAHVLGKKVFQAMGSQMQKLLKQECAHVTEAEDGYQ